MRELIAELLALGLGALFSAVLLPVVMRLAVAFNVVDKPGGRRKHSDPIPRVGGIAVIVASATAAAISLTLLGGRIIPSISLQVHPIVIGGLMVFAIGIADDVLDVAPWVKLVVQGAAAMILVNAGLSAEAFTAAKGLHVYHIGMFAPALTVLWIVGVTNAFNLIDGIDGLAVMCAAVALATSVVAGSRTHHTDSYIFVMALLGALFAFSRQNRHPARVFLGDAGSMTLGFLLSARAITSATDYSGTTYAIVPLAALAYPLLDTTAAIGRRWLRGHSFSRADGRHIHHQLLTVGLSAPQAVWLIGALSSVVAVMGLSIAFAPPQFTFALALGAAVLIGGALVYGVWWLGYGEFAAVGTSLVSGVMKARSVVRQRIRAIDVANHVQTATNEAELRECLRGLVDSVHVHGVELVEPSTERRRGAPRTWGMAPDPNVIRVECPVRRASTGDVLTLSVMISRTGVSHHVVERVAFIIREEVEKWYATYDAREVTAAAATTTTLPDPGLPIRV